MNNLTCALIITGDEILSGRTRDANIHHLAKKVAEIGVDLKEFRGIPDDEQTIINTVNELRAKYTYVFTTGGIGPTHDDITTECIAKAFGVKIYRDKAVVNAFKVKYAEKANESMLKMADFPVGCELIPNYLTTAPGFKMENVFVMADIPDVMQVMLEFILPSLEKGSVVQSKHVDIPVGESVIGKPFKVIQKKYGETVSLGSYPFKYKDGHGASLVLRSANESLLEDAFNDVCEMVKKLNIEIVNTG